MEYKKLYEFVNKEGKEYFTQVKRTNHFIVLEMFGGIELGSLQKKLKRIKGIVYIKFDGSEIWIRVKGSLNSFMGKLDGTVKIGEFDRYDKDLWLWYIENETPFKYRWFIALFSRWF